MGPVKFRRTLTPSANRRPIYDANGRLWSSCTEAAIAKGLSIAAIYQRARLSRMGWRFATVDEVLAAESPPAREE